MSNTVKIKQMNGGRLTRPRGQWTGKVRHAREIADHRNLRQLHRAQAETRSAISGLMALLHAGRQHSDRRSTS